MSCSRRNLSLEILPLDFLRTFCGSFASSFTGDRFQLINDGLPVDRCFLFGFCFITNVAPMNIVCPVFAAQLSRETWDTVRALTRARLAAPRRLLRLESSDSLDWKIRTNH